MALVTRYGKDGAGLYAVGGKHGRKKPTKARRPARKRVEYKDDRPVYASSMGSEFYLTKEWRTIRATVLMNSNGRCKLCGRGEKHGICVHVDHIKPRSQFPELELSYPNLQVLCEDCNLGKGARIWPK